MKKIKSTSFPKKVIIAFRYAIQMLRNRLSFQQFRLLSCIIVSVEVALSTVALKMFVFYLEKISFHNIHSRAWFWYPPLLCFTGIGISSLLVKKVFRKNFLKGNDKIVYAIAKKMANLPFSEMYSPLITSGITIGLGGSAGLESPIVAAGSAIGSNTGRIAYLSRKDKTLLIACGVAAGISTAFSAPVAGVLFAVEVLMIDISVSSFIPLLLAGAIGSLISQVVLGNNILLSFVNMRPFIYANTPYYVLLGILSGGVALYYARAYEWVEHKFEKISSAAGRWTIGSILLGFLIILHPSLFGEGYQLIKVLADTGELPESAKSFLFFHNHNQWFLLLLTFTILLFKVFATSFTILGGGNGGSFAPSLFIGGLLGFILGKSCLLLGMQDIPLANFIVAGMAGTLSGIFFAPLTAIFLSAELTNGYSLFIPLMIVAAISFGIVRFFEPLSMEMKKLKEKTALDPMDRDQFLLSRMELSTFIDSDYPTLTITDGMDRISEIIRNCRQNLMVVLDDNGKYLGVIFLNDIIGVLFKRTDENPSIHISDIMVKIPSLNEKDRVYDTLKQFEEARQQFMELPVLDNEDKWLGFVKKSDIMDQYRDEIMGNSF